MAYGLNENENSLSWHDVTYGQVWCPILGFLTHPKCTHTQQWTHTHREHTPGAVGSHLRCGARWAVGVAQTSRLVDFNALHDALSLKLTSRWSYRGRNRIINPHLRSVSKQLKLQTNSYSECAPQYMCDYITGCWKLNGRMHVLNSLLYR